MHLGPHVAEVLAAKGFFVVGFDVKAYLESFTSGKTTLRTEDEPGDYKVLADFAARGTNEKPILIGVSEGAGLSVLAATDPRTKTAIAGVIGLGLPDLNELGWRWNDAVIYLTHGDPHEPTFSVAAIVDRMAPVPLAAIHSTHDEFVPLAQVQQVLDARKEPKRLWIVNAADHRFSDNLPEFDRALARSHHVDHPDAARVRHRALSGRVRQRAAGAGRARALRCRARGPASRAARGQLVRTDGRRRRHASQAARARDRSDRIELRRADRYDQLAFVYIGKPLPRARIALTSFLAYAISNNVGLAMLSGASVRYRFYTRWGVTPEELSRIVFSYSVTFWLGLFALGGLSLVVTPLPGGRELPAHHVVTLAGWLLMLVPLAYVAVTTRRRKPLRLWRVELPMPSPGIAGAQLALSSLDWALAGAVLYVLLPPSSLSFVAFLGLFFVAILLGMASHVPGGVGVFEGLMVLLLKPYLTSGQLLPALVVFRGVYYLMPLSVALIALVLDDAHQRRGQAARVGAALGRVTEQFTPRVLAILTFARRSGPVVLGRHAGVRATPGPARPCAAASGHRGIALPGQRSRRRTAGALAGARPTPGRCLLSGVGSVDPGHCRLDGQGLRLRRGNLLLLVLAVLWRARTAFDRRAAFFETRFSAAWVASLDRCGRGVRLARAVRVQARGLFARALVAVRAAG